MNIRPTGALALVAGWGLDRGPVDSVEPLDVGRLLPELRQHKLVGVARAVVEADAIEVDDRRLLAEAHESAMAEALLLEDVMLVAVDALAESGIDTRVLKGSALAHLLGPDPAERMFGDTDLLVRGESLTRAAGALQRIGATRAHPGVSADFERRFAKSITLTWRAGTELDLHRTLAPGPYGLAIDAAELFRHTITFDLAGRAVPTVSLEMHAVHAAIHVALGDVEPRLGNVRDLALLLRHDLDLDLVMRTVEAWGCAYPMAIGLRAATGIGAGDHALLDWAEAYRPSQRERSSVASYRDRAGRFRAQAWASLRVLGWRDRAAYLRALTTNRRD